MRIIEITCAILSGGQSSKIAISTTSAQSATIAVQGNDNVATLLITPDTTCFARYGSNPTAVSDGTDQILLANNTYRVDATPGGKFAFITATGTGFVYITPGA
jgi:D-alanine-D-alanine ligase-like ATP-grasp enzyme